MLILYKRLDATNSILLAENAWRIVVPKKNAYFILKKLNTTNAIW